VHIDRAACAWLIRRFVDPDAAFLFVADPRITRAIKQGNTHGACRGQTISALSAPRRR